MPQPMQDVYLDEQGVARFRPNAIVRWLLDTGPFDMNVIGATPFSREDREQFAQLIGYSVSGFGELAYADEFTISTADRIAESLLRR